MESTTVTAEETVSETAKEECCCQASEGREERLEKLAKNHILASMGVGLIPIPLVDMVALMGIQLDLLKKMSCEYEVPFKEGMGKSIIASLLGGLLPASLGAGIASLIKFIPIIGQTTGAVTMPVISGASTYALYKVFLQHFESGGTFLDLDPGKVKQYFAEQFSRGKKVAAEMKESEPVNTAA